MGEAVRQLRRMGLPIPDWSDTDPNGKPVLYWPYFATHIRLGCMYVRVETLDGDVSNHTTQSLSQCASAYYHYQDMREHGALV
jgi:hypothetical protein